MKIAIICAGSGGQAIATSLAIVGHEVRVFNRSGLRLESLKNCHEWRCYGALSAIGRPALVSSEIGDCLDDAKLIIVTSTADAHASLASLMAPYVVEGQIVVLMPGRTGGALEVRKIFDESGVSRNVYVAETQTLIYACREIIPGHIQILGVKSKVNISTFPSKDIKLVINLLQKVLNSLKPVEHVLETSFENVGAILHPASVLFKAVAIDGGECPYLYQGNTEKFSKFLEELDNERTKMARAYGVEARSLKSWIKDSYPSSSGENLIGLMNTNPAYNSIRSPSSLNSRLLNEDIPTGLIPFIAFGEIAGLEMNMMRSITTILGSLLSEDFFKKGRTLDKLGLKSNSPRDIINEVMK